MKEFLRKIRNAVCYCGVSKEEYRDLKKEAYASNFTVWKYLHVLMALGYLMLAVLSIASRGFGVHAIADLAIVAYAVTACVLFFFVLRKDALLPQFIIYLSMILLLLSALIINKNQPHIGDVTFSVLVVMLPMFMIDKPYFMGIVLTCAVGIFLYLKSGMLNGQELWTEEVCTIVCAMLGIIINVFYNSVRIHEFKLQKQQKEYIEEQRHTDEETRKLNETLKKMSESAVDLLGDVVENRNLESGEHIQRVKGFTYILANQVSKDLPEYGLDQYQVDLITFTSALHDVGKIAISDAILCKPGRLTAEEFEIMKTHCERGREILSKMEDKWSRDYLEMGLSICMSHHEKWDGKGYPCGLKGDEIPIAAQIVSLADVYDALTTKRVYKDAYSCETAYRMILNGECGAFSEKLLRCFTKCRAEFEKHAAQSDQIALPGREYELVSKANPSESFVIGLHDQNRTLRERVRLSEEVSVLESLSEALYYVCYVDMPTNEVKRYKADPQIERILDSYGDQMRSNERFDKLLNSVIVADDYATFREETERDHCMMELRDKGHVYADFRIRLEDGVHYCRMKITLDPNNSSAVIIGIYCRDEEHLKEMEYLNMQQELEVARREIESQEKLADRLAVIDCISSEYDYVCSLNADTMEVVVYRAAAWIRDMFKNLEDIVVSPEVRDSTLRGIVHPDDFDQFQEGSKHSSVLKGLSKTGSYEVNYRAYKYGQLVNYQTRYALDRKNPKRIIIGLHCVRGGNGQAV